jgi:hypothetical protein
LDAGRAVSAIEKEKEDEGEGEFGVEAAGEPN